MNTTELIRPPAPAGHNASGGASENPTFRAMLAELVPLVEAIAGYGPPVILVGPWVLLALMLAGPFAVLLTLVVVMLVAAIVPVALVAGPYLLIRRVRDHRAQRAISRDHAAQLVPVGSTRVLA
jgi:hypothetical protein